MTTFDPSSREAEAHAEIAATRIGRGVAALLFAGFVAMLLAGPLLEAGALARGESALFAPLPVAAEGGTPLARARQLIAELEDRFDERSALVRLVRAPAQRVLTRRLGQGNERALVGRDGWLFLADDVAHLVERAPGERFAGDPEREIVAFRDALAARGVALVVVPVPGKPSIHPERLGAFRAPDRATLALPLRRAGELETLARLAARGVELVDLGPRFARDAAAAPLYLATDTHWRPEAVETAAAEIAIRLRELTDLPPGLESAPGGSPRTIEGRGDLVALLGLDLSAFPRESVELEPAHPPDPAPTRRGRAPVLLLGDSFAAIYSSNELGWGAGAGLPERLAARLGLPVDAIVQNAGGASATRERLARELAADPSRLDGVRAVVWLFAAREWSQGEWREVELPGRSGSPRPPA